MYGDPANLKSKRKIVVDIKTENEVGATHSAFNPGIGGNLNMQGYF